MNNDKIIDDLGFCFDYDKDKHKISKSISVSGDALRRLSEAYPIGGNYQNIYIYCTKCKKFMLFWIEKDKKTGYWICPNCETKVRESTPYHQLERENKKFLKDGQLDEYADDDYDEYYGYLE